MMSTPSQLSGSARFVILHHRLADGEHWDFMIEVGEVLWTWQLTASPIDRPADAIPARRIGEHRKAYLTYEGPVSRDRGTVERVDDGTYRFEEVGAERIVVRLEGRRGRGVYQLSPGPGETWTFAPVVPG